MKQDNEIIQFYEENRWSELTVYEKARMCDIIIEGKYKRPAYVPDKVLKEDQGSKEFNTSNKAD